MQNKWFLRLLPSFLLKSVDYSGGLYPVLESISILPILDTALHMVLTWPALCHIFPDQQLWGPRVLVSLMLVSLNLGIMTLSLQVINVDEVLRNLQSLFQPFWVYPSPFPPGPHSRHCSVLGSMKTHARENTWLTHYTVIYKACVLWFPGAFEF